MLHKTFVVQVSRMSYLIFYSSLHPLRPYTPKECQRQVEPPELLMTACSRHCKNGHCTPTGKCCCSPGWEGPFCRIGGCLRLFTCTRIPIEQLLHAYECTRAYLSLLLYCSQMWASLPQRRSVYGAQQVPVQEWLFWGPVWEEWGGYA